MPMNNIDLANYNQTTIPCKYCPSAVKRSKLPFHVARCHQDEILKERERERERELEVEVEFPDTPSLVPERPICHIVPNDDTENWDDSDSPTYNPLLATSHKDVIRGIYYQGFSKEEKKRCQKFEIVRMAQIKERNRENFETTYQPESFVPVSQPEISYDSDTSEESWSESSISFHSTPSELDDENSFRTCNGGDTNILTGENLSSFESSVAEYLRNLSEEKRAEVVREFNKIMRKQ